MQTQSGVPPPAGQGRAGLLCKHGGAEVEGEQDIAKVVKRREEMNQPSPSTGVSGGECEVVLSAAVLRCASE